MRDLVFLCDWLPPDFGAVGQYALQYARQRASGGEDVVLYGLTSDASFVEQEFIGGDQLKIVRLPCGRRRRRGRIPNFGIAAPYPR